MITAFRNFFASTFGKIAAFALLALIAVAFAASDISGGAGFGGVGAGNAAKVGSEQIGVGELRDRVRRSYNAARESEPTLTMEDFVRDGGVENALSALIDASAFQQYAAKLGFANSKRLVDAQIAQLPVFTGLTGQFDQAQYEAFLRRENLTDRQVRADMERQLLLNKLTRPINALPGIAPAIAEPYAALLLERRRGSAVFVPSSPRAPSTAPSDAQLTTFLKNNSSRYAIPERRVIRYATFDRSNVPVPEPTQADLESFYKDNAARFTASQSRRLNQVVAPSQAVAQRIADAVRGGATLDAAARSNGLASSFSQSLAQADLTRTTNADFAKAAFAAPRGGLVGPVQLPLGWAVATVQDIRQTPARTLEQALPEIRPLVARQMADEAMISFFNAIQDALNNGVPVTEIAADRKLTLAETPALLPSGRAPARTDFQLPPELGDMVPQAFQALGEGEGQLFTIVDNDRFALFDVKTIVAAAPPPLTSIRAQLVTDWKLAEGHKAARDVARAMVRAVEGKTPLADAARAAKGEVGSVQTIAGTRGELTRSADRVPPEVALMFSMAAGSVRTLELPGQRGWLVIYLDEVVRPKREDIQTEQIGAIAAPLANAIGGELFDQLLADARQRVGVARNMDQVERLKAELSGRTSAPGL